MYSSLAKLVQHWGRQYCQMFTCHYLLNVSKIVRLLQRNRLYVRFAIPVQQSLYFIDILSARTGCNNRHTLHHSIPNGYNVSIETFFTEFSIKLGEMFVFLWRWLDFYRVTAAYDTRLPLQLFRVKVQPIYR